MANTPNYQGMFLRGHGGQATYHWGGVWHSSAALGVVQGDAIRNIYGHLGKIAEDWGWNPTSGAFSAVGNGVSHRSDTSRWHVVNFDASRVVPTTNENRPVNMAVRYLIRAKP